MENKFYFYFDMDGVLAIFDELCANTQPYNIAGAHFFRSRRPDINAIQLLKTLDAADSNCVRILSRIYVTPDRQSDIPILLKEHEADKQAWIGHHVSVSQQNKSIILLQTNKKSTVIEHINQSDRRRHILIDDEPSVLQDWHNCGGTGVQYWNENHPIDRWNNAPIIKSSDTTHAAIRLLHDLTKQIEQETEG